MLQPWRKYKRDGTLSVPPELQRLLLGLLGDSISLLPRRLVSRTLALYIQGQGVAAGVIFALK